MNTQWQSQPELFIIFYSESQTVILWVYSSWTIYKMIWNGSGVRPRITSRSGGQFDNSYILKSSRLLNIWYQVTNLHREFSDWLNDGLDEELQFNIYVRLCSYSESPNLPIKLYKVVGWLIYL